MYKLYCRIYQKIFYIGEFLLPWRRPQLLEGKDSISKLPQLLKGYGLDKVLVVTDKGISSLGLMDSMLNCFKNEGIDYVIFDETVPNPTIDNVETALRQYKIYDCKGLVAFGGGSSMDCAKGVGARIARPNKSIPKLRGLFKVMKKLPPLIAIPTTAGTGSEATIAAVFSNPRTHEKYPVMDISLVPQIAVLDPMITVALPPHITSTTGMDALTHAVEAYIGNSNTKSTRDLCRKAIKLIYENIYRAYSNGEDLDARENMLKASHYAGIAFTRANVGYVHAIAHTLGGFYGVPHGLANAVILPYVLEYYGAPAHKSLAELADLVGITKPSDTIELKAHEFIESVRELNRKMNIPENISDIVDGDIPMMVIRALSEANPFYPVPRILLTKDITALYHMIK